MSTTSTPVSVIHAAQSTSAPVPVPVAAPAAPSVGSKINTFFHHVLDYVKSHYMVLLTDVIQYTPKAELLAEACMPEFAGLEKGASIAVVDGFTLLRNTVITIEQKYSDSPSGTASSAKLADAISIAGDTFTKLAAIAGIGVGPERLKSIVGGVVAILKTSKVPENVASVPQAS